MTEQLEKEYTDEVMDIIEFLYGTSYLSQGGPDAVDGMLQGIDLKGKVIADIGCGNGGPLIHIAKHYPISHALGVDVDPDILMRANNAATKAQVTNIEWIQSTPEQALPLESNSVDIVIGKESWLHINNKLFFFEELHRILKPEGIIICIDWMHKSQHYSNLMKQFVHADGLSFHLCTIAEYVDNMGKAGFTDISHEEKSNDALKHSRHDVEQLCDPEIADQFVQRFGDNALSTWLCSWLMQSEVFARGEMQTFQIKAYKK